MDIKIYKKRGATNYKEKRLIRDLESAFEKLIAENPEFAGKFKSAENFEQLQSLHSQYCIEDAHIISEQKNDPMEDANKPAETHKFESQDTIVDDPLNRSNPKMRDYVLHDTFVKEGSERPTVGGKPMLEEPKSYEEAFQIPDEDLDEKTRKENKSAADKAAQNASGGPNNSNSGPKPTKQENSFNPQFDELTQARKNKQIKRFAANIVKTVCAALEFGYVWWLTKDINEDKLVEYQMDDKIELTLLITLDNEQEASIKEFFALKCQQAEQDSKISIEDQDELADALADVLSEKGIAPTPMQNLAMVGLRVIGGKLVNGLMSKSVTDMILKKGFAMRKAEKDNTEEGVAETIHSATNKSTASAASATMQTTDNVEETQDSKDEAEGATMELITTN